MNQLDQVLDHNFVQFGENVQEKVAFICNSGGCCCEALLAANRFLVLRPIATLRVILFAKLVQNIGQVTLGCGSPENEYY